MAKDSYVLRYIFGFFNLLFALSGVAIIILAIILHVKLSNVQEFGSVGFVGVVELYVIGFITLAISFLGAYGAFREVKWMLVTFLVLMCIGFLIMLRLSVVLAISQNKVDNTVEEELRKFSQLDKTSDDLQEFMNAIQQNVHCCGLFKGYEDWGEHVPPSCDCTSEGEHTPNDVCVAMPKNIYETVLFQQERSKRMVYSQTCGPLAVALIMKIYVGMMGVLFGLAALTGLAIMFSSCLIAQINRSRAAGVVVAPTLMFSPQGQMKYNHLVNEPYH